MSYYVQFRNESITGTCVDLGAYRPCGYGDPTVYSLKSAVCNQTNAEPSEDNVAWLR